MAEQILTPGQLKWISQQPADSDAWGVFNNEAYNPYLKKLNLAYRDFENNNRGNIENSGPRGPATYKEHELLNIDKLYAGKTPEQIMNQYDVDSQILADAISGKNKTANLRSIPQTQDGRSVDITQYLTAASRAVTKSYVDQVNTFSGSPDTVKKNTEHYYWRKADSKSSWNDFRDSVIGAVGNFVLPAATLGLSNLTNADEKLMPKGAQDFLDPGLQAVSGTAGAGAYSGYKNTPSVTDPDKIGYAASDLPGAPGAQPPLWGGATSYPTDLNATNLATAAIGGDSVFNPGFGPTGAPVIPGVPNVPGSTPSTVPSGIPPVTPSGTTPSLVDVLTGVLPPVLGYVGADKMADAQTAETERLRKLAEEYSGYGAPYREKLSALYNDPNSFLTSDEVQKPVQLGTDMLSRSLSMGGNPVGSGNALQQLQSYSSDQLFGRLGQEKDRLAGFGGLADYNAAAPGIASGATGVNPYDIGKYNAIGSGIETLSNIFNPKKSSWDKYLDRLNSGQVP